MTIHKLTKDSQRGQALPVGIALILFGTLFGLVLFNSAQMVTEKSRLANAADAAAYSGLVWQARALNFSAYTNRAMVANQVSIAQFVSLNSWTRYALDMTRHANNTIGLIPPVRPYTQTAEGYAETANTVVENIASVAIPVISGVNEVLSNAQEVMYKVSFFATPQIVKDVAKANNKNYRADSEYAMVSQSANLSQWNSFSKRYDAENEGLSRKVGVIRNSLDAFSSKRNWKLGSFYFTPTNRVKVVKEGTTQLREKNGEYSWVAKDGLSLHWQNFRCSWRKGCGWRHSEVAVGGAGAYASRDICGADYVGFSKGRDRNGSDGTGLFNHRAGNRCKLLSSNKKAEKRADRFMDGIDRYGGVKAYRDLSDLSESNRDPRILLRVKLHVDVEQSKAFNPIEHSDSSAEPSAGGEIASVSSAELYFKRPDNLQQHQQGRPKEYGSLFNPFWQVRLANTPRAEQMAAWVTQDQSIVKAGSGFTEGLLRYGRQQQAETRSIFSQQYASPSPVTDGYSSSADSAVHALTNGLDSGSSSARRFDPQSASSAIREQVIVGRENDSSVEANLIKHQFMDALQTSAAVLAEEAEHRSNMEELGGICSDCASQEDFGK